MLFKTAAATALIATATAAPATDLLERQNGCSSIHIFGARETTAPAGYGTAGTFVNLILNAHPGATAEAISYPAAGGSSYAASVQAGTQSYAKAINSYNQRCPKAELVVIGYSQGSQILDNALCGGGDPNQGITYTYPLITSSASNAIKAVIWAGNPRHTPGSPFNYGTSNAAGFDPRPQGFSCPTYTSRIRSYCDAADPYCSNGNDGNVHQSYGRVYGQNALAFVNARL